MNNGYGKILIVKLKEFHVYGNKNNLSILPDEVK